MDSRQAPGRSPSPPSRSITSPPLVSEVLVGTSGFSFKEWKGPFYPADLKDDAMNIRIQELGREIGVEIVASRGCNPRTRV